MTYATLNELKGYLSMGTADALDDAQLNDALSSASDLIDGYCGRSFAAAGTATATRVYAPQSSGYVAIDDAAEVTAVATSSNLDGTYDTDWDAADWQSEPLNGVLAGKAWPVTTVRAIGTKRFRVCVAASVQVTARFGWSATPAPVKQATLIQASRLFKRSGATLGITGNAETGLMRVTGSMDSDAARLLLPFRRSTGVAVA